MIKQTQEAQLQENNLCLLDEEQKKVVLTQWQEHQHEDFQTDYDVSGERDTLNGFILKKGVWNPFLASGRYHARYLFYHTDLFYGKTAIEIGSGTGLMSIVMAKFGAKKVIASDISQLAVENTQDNVDKFGIQNVVKVVQGDLYENVHEKADTIAWMIPFFSGIPPKGDTISASMMMPPELFERFLIESPEYLRPNGVILIPSFSLGGDLNNPQIVAKKIGYDVRTTWAHRSINGIQQGMIYLHELSVPG